MGIVDSTWKLVQSHPYLAGVLILLIILGVIAALLFAKTMKKLSSRPISEDQEYRERMATLFQGAWETFAEIEARAKALRRLNNVFTLIEIIGGAYVGIASGVSAIFGSQQSKGQAVGNLIIGFLIAVTSGCQHAFHPFTKAKIWQRRAWVLEDQIKRLESQLNWWYEERKTRDVPKLHIEDELNAATFKAEEPFDIDSDVKSQVAQSQTTTAAVTPSPPANRTDAPAVPAKG